MLASSAIQIWFRSVNFKREHVPPSQASPTPDPIRAIQLEVRFLTRMMRHGKHAASGITLLSARARPGGTEGINFRGNEDVERLPRALRHAIVLCGGNLHHSSHARICQTRSAA